MKQLAETKRMIERIEKHIHYNQVAIERKMAVGVLSKNVTSMVMRWEEENRTLKMALLIMREWK